MVVRGQVVLQTFHLLGVFLEPTHALLAILDEFHFLFQGLGVI